jgi:putative oxidoreductase
MTSHIQNGFFMNWFGNQKGEGFEFDLLVIGLSITAMIEGAGKYSLDAKLFN